MFRVLPVAVLGASGSHDAELVAEADRQPERDLDLRGSWAAREGALRPEHVADLRLDDLQTDHACALRFHWLAVDEQDARGAVDQIQPVVRHRPAAASRASRSQGVPVMPLTVDLSRRV